MVTYEAILIARDPKLDWILGIVSGMMSCQNSFSIFNANLINLGSIRVFLMVSDIEIRKIKRPRNDNLNDPC